MQLFSSYAFHKIFNKRQDFEITFNCFFFLNLNQFFQKKNNFPFEFYLCERNKIVNGQLFTINTGSFLVLNSKNWIGLNGQQA